MKTPNFGRIKKMRVPKTRGLSQMKNRINSVARQMGFGFRRGRYG